MLDPLSPSLVWICIEEVVVVFFLDPYFYKLEKLGNLM